MRKRLLLMVLVWLSWCGSAPAMQRFFSYCQKGGYTVTTQGLQSTNVFQQTFTSCTVHVYLAGTTNLATIYSDNASPTPTPLANPFTSASDGFFFFYAIAGRYDVQLTSSTGTPQYTWGDVTLCDPLGPNPDAGCTPGGTGATHDLLSLTHLDTIPASPPTRGDVISAQAQTSPSGVTPSWARLPLGTLKQCLTSNGTDVVWSGCWWNAYNNGTLVGTEQGLNLIGGTNVTFTPFTDNPGADRVDVTANSVQQYQNNGTAVGAEPVLNLIPGTNVSLTPFTDSGGKVNVTINSTAGTTGGCAAPNVQSGTVCAGPPIQNGVLSSELVQNAFASTDTFTGMPATASVSVPTNGPITSGDTLVVWVRFEGDTSPSANFTINDSQRNTFTVAHGGTESVYTAPITTTGSDTVTCAATVTNSTPYDLECAVIEMANLGSFDAFTAGSTATIPGTASATLTTVANNDIVLVFGHTKDGNNSALTYTGMNANFHQAAQFPSCGGAGCNAAFLLADSFAPTAGNYSYSVTSSGGGFLLDSTFISAYAFTSATPTWPTSGPPYFRPPSFLDLIGIATESQLPFTYTGNTTELATWTGATTSAKCVDTDTHGNLKVTSSDCGLTGVNTVTFSATPTFNLALGSVQEITLTGNVTSFTVSNPTAGQNVTFIWKQDATGGWTVSGVPASLHGFTSPGATASTRSTQVCTYDGTDFTCGVASVNIP